MPVPWDACMPPCKQRHLTVGSLNPLSYPTVYRNPDHSVAGVGLARGLPAWLPSMASQAHAHIIRRHAQRRHILYSQRMGTSLPAIDASHALTQSRSGRWRLCHGSRYSFTDYGIVRTGLAAADGVAAPGAHALAQAVEELPRALAAAVAALLVRVAPRAHARPQVVLFPCMPSPGSSADTFTASPGLQRFAVTPVMPLLTLLKE